MEEAPESRISLSHKAVINKVFDDRMTESVGVGPISVSLAWGPATVIASCGPAGEHGARGSGVAELVVVNKVVVVVVVSVHASASGLRGGGEGGGWGGGSCPWETVGWDGGTNTRTAASTHLGSPPSSVSS